MPKLYEYLGMIIMFYSNEHEPIHVHCKRDDRECKADIIFIDGKFKEVVLLPVQGKKPLLANDAKKFLKLVNLFRDDIVRKWVDFFVYNKEIKCEKINEKI